MAKRQDEHKSFAFVSDWQDRSSQNQTRFNRILAIALGIAFLTTALFFYWFKHENQETIVNNNMKYLQICGVQEADRVEAAFAEGEMLIANIAGRYSTMMKLLPDTTVMEKLELLVDTKLFDRIGHVSLEGIDITLEGIADVSDRDYFRRGMRGETGHDFLKASRVTGKPCVVFYTPIMTEGQIEGVMIGFYEAARLNDMFSMEMFSYSPNTYLLQGDGSVVCNSNNDIENENMLEALTHYEFHSTTGYDDVMKAIADRSRTSIMFEFHEKGGMPSVGVITQLQNCDWMILTVLPASVNSTMIASTNRIGRVLMLGVSSVFILLIVVVVVFISRQAIRTKTEMRDTQEKLKLAMELEQKQAFIVNTLASSYPSVYRIDVDTGAYERIEERQQSSVEAISAEGAWPDAVEIYVNRFVAEDYKETVAQFLDVSRFGEYLAGRDNVSVEFMRSDGMWRKMFLLPAWRDEDGKLLAVIFAVQRLDEEKEKEMLAQKALQEAFAAAQFASDAKTTFLSNMSHDIRTPMNAIIGMTMIATNNLDNRSRVADCLSKISASCRHLLGLINEILDMSKIESGKVELNEEAFSLSELVDELVGMNQVLIKEKEHHLTVDTSGLVHTNVLGDKTRLQQVFTNLLTNAIKYTPAGGRLEITVTEDSASTTAVGKYRAVFRDNGIGMSEEYMKTLFEPFTRARDKRLIGIQGTGLGLPIARNILRMMNGDIEVESELDHGSAFKVAFMLKLQPEDAQRDIKETDTAAAAEADFTGRRILLVEDNELNMEIAVEILSMLGLEIDTASNGREAVDKVLASESGRYDLVFMDVQMPVMDGYEATGAIRASAHPDAKTIPIVAMTANAFSADIRAAISAGMNDHIAKPIDVGCVVKALEKYTGSKQRGES